MASGDCFIRLDELDTLDTASTTSAASPTRSSSPTSKKKRALIENSLCDSAGARTQERAKTSLFIAKIASQLGKSTILLKFQILQQIVISVLLSVLLSLFSGAKLLLFSDIHKFMCQKKYTFFPIICSSLSLVLN